MSSRPSPWNPHRPALSRRDFLTRTGLRVELYNDMERQARSALELFARDTREASAITWNSTQSVTLIVCGPTLATLPKGESG